MVKTAIRYYYQLRYLTWVQIYWRIRMRLRSARVSGPVAQPAWALPPGSWISPASMPHRLCGENRFSLLGQERQLELPAGWHDRQPGKKWLIELHTFHFLGSLPTAAGRALIQSWLDHNPGFSGPGWHPYMTSQRIASWLKWGLSGGDVDAAMRESIAMQVKYLLQVLAYDELDHKLFNNGKALLFAGYCLDDAAAGAWRARGMALVERYSIELLGDDGGYIGLSPMYHCALLNDLLDVVNLLRAYNQPVPGQLERAIAAARFWLVCMCHPDGHFALFNDAAFEAGPSPSDLDAYAVRLDCPAASGPGSELVHLGASGFARMSLGAAVALLDIGRIGPDHFPSHGHADSLTFELSLDDQRVVVDTGLSTYEAVAERLRQRATAAHNTVQVDERNSSDVWHLFKVGRRAAVSAVELSSSPGQLQVSAAHDGYSRLLHAVVHRREWRMRAGQLEINDRLEGRGGQHALRVAFHLHPDIVPRQLQSNRFSLDLPDGRTLGELELAPGLQGALEAYDYHPGFGKSVAATCITGRMSGSLPMAFRSTLTWQTGPG